MPSRPNRPRELARRLARDGITITRSKGGDLQFRYCSESLGGKGGGSLRKVNGATLGRVRNGRTGTVLRLDARGILRALGTASRIMQRIELEQERDRDS